jgi:hypothetical protein
MIFVVLAAPPTAAQELPLYASSELVSVRYDTMPSDGLATAVERAELEA